MIELTRLGLGSWRTYESMSPEDGVAVMRAARDAGIRFLDDARYDDRTGKAPLPTGYSEVRFGELFRAAGWDRDEVVVANKLWWEFWPAQSAAEELDASLGRMGFDHVDLIYSWDAPSGPPLEVVVDSVAGLIAAGKARAWGTGNWSREEHEAAIRLAEDVGVEPPVVAQLPYNLTLREPVEDGGAHPVVASWVLAGGVLSGKYVDRAVEGRMAGRVDPRAHAVTAQLGLLARELDSTPAPLALAFALANERVVSVLFGATTPAQVAEDVAALDLVDRLSRDDLERLRAIADAAPA